MGMTVSPCLGPRQAAFLRQCGGVASNSFKNFMSMKAVPRTDHNDWKQCQVKVQESKPGSQYLLGSPLNCCLLFFPGQRSQAGAGNHFYPKAFHFFEKLRVAEGK